MIRHILINKIKIYCNKMIIMKAKKCLIKPISTVPSANLSAVIRANLVKITFKIKILLKKWVRK